MYSILCDDTQQISNNTISDKKQEEEMIKKQLVCFLIHNNPYYLGLFWLLHEMFKHL